MATRLLGPAVFEQTIKKSVFVARVVPLREVEAVHERLAALSDRKASHNAWAFVVGDERGFSDDREVRGTAGKPILATLEGAGVQEALVVVTRYYGGIKLGKGGLVRAYGGSAREALRLAPVEEVVPLVRVVLGCSYGDLGRVEGFVEKHGLGRVGERYLDGGVELHLEVEAGRAEGLRQSLQEETGGRARWGGGR